MLYTESHPAPALKPWVAAHWHFRVDPQAPEMDHWIPPNGGVMLSIIPSGEALLTGPRTEPLQTRVQGGLKVWGSLFWPGAAPSLLGIDVEALRSRQIPAQLALGEPTAARLREAFATVADEAQAAKALDTLLLERLPPPRPLDEKVLQAVFRLIQSNGGETVAAMAAAVDLSPRQLRRRFRREVGLTPKELARIQRLRASAVEAVFDDQEPWVAIAANRGYADQAHLIREFQHLLGLTPSGFERHFRRIHHGKIVR